MPTFDPWYTHATMNAERNMSQTPADAPLGEATPDGRDGRPETVAERFARVVTEIGTDARQAPLAYARETRVPAGGE